MANHGTTKRFLIREMDRSIKQMKKLVEDEGDSFAKKAEIYCQKRPKLVAHVEEFYRMFRSLAERYHEAKTELRKCRPPTDLRSQNSLNFDMFSEPPSAVTSPDRRLSRRLSEVPNFDYFKAGYETPTVESESDSDESVIQTYSNSSNYRRLRKKIVELESELRKAQMENEENRSNSEIEYYAEELRIAKEKIQSLEEEIDRLRMKLQKYETMEHGDDISDESVDDFETPRVNDRLAEDTLEQEVKRFRRELDQKQLDGEKQKLSEENSQLQEQVTRLSKQKKMNDNIREWERCRRLEDHLEGIRNQKNEMEDEIEQLKMEREGIRNQKNEMEDEIEQLKMDREGILSRISELEEEMSLKDDQIDEMNDRLEKLHIENQKSINCADELRLRSGELKKTIEKQQEMIEEAGEEKRQAIRQLSFTLEHYRNAYQMLRKDVLEKKKPVMASQGDVVSI